MKIPFRTYHLLKILQEFDSQTLPLDLFISLYFRKNSALGSKDRAAISDKIYSIIRWKGLVDYLSPKPVNWEVRLQVLEQIENKKFHIPQTIPSYVKCSFPQDLFELLKNYYGNQKAIEICLASNTAAPTTIRVNTLKISREALLKRWKSQYEITPCRLSGDGIIFERKINFFTTQEFKEGLFEVQDEGSQLLAGLVDAQPSEKILDYCSGAGGKTLAFAPKMNNKGQIYLHDVRNHALAEAKKRLKRAGVQNAQILEANAPALKILKKKMDKVLVDVPCSGTGTLRRNPDIKWRFNKEMLYRLIGQQRVIFEKALSFLRPEGKIIYATCSLLAEENEQQVEHFIKSYGLKVHGEPFKSIPEQGKMDGFFGAVFRFE